MGLNREQIIKALECWASRSPCHEKCSILEHEEGANCIGLTTRSAVALIKELTEENERLQAIVDLQNKRKWYTKYVKEIFQKEKNDKLLYPDFDYIYEQYFKLLDENERLRADNARYEAENNAQFDKWLKLEEATKRHHEELFQDAKIAVKEDTVRKMRSEIKERCIKGGIYPAFIASTIDQITKEMLEGENEQSRNSRL